MFDDQLQGHINTLTYHVVWDCLCRSPWRPLGLDKHSGTPSGMPLPAVEKEEKRQIRRTACSHRSGCELVLKQALQPQRANPQCTRSAGQIMNDSIVGCYGDLTLNKLTFFFSVESSCLAWRRWPEAHYCGAPVSLGFHLRTSRLWGKQKKRKPPKLHTIRERLHNAHLTAGWGIWLRFGSSLTHTKRKNQRGFGLILLALRFLSPCWLKGECERRQSDLLTERCRTPFSIF